MSADQVAEIMAYPGKPITADWTELWEDSPLPKEESSRVASAVWYSVNTFYLPVSFEFTFDEQQRVVGKHIRD